MKPLPQGKSLGWMQAPASWITTHTSRFIGVVRVLIKGGEGFILIKKGKPLFYYFKQGTTELKGNRALDYFNSHALIDFNLCKYNRDEFAWALNLCNIEDHDPVVANVSVPVSRQPTVPFRPADPSVPKPAGDKRIPEPDPVYPKEQRIENRTTVSVPVSRQPTMASSPVDPPAEVPAGDKRIPEPDLVYPKDQRIENRTTVSGPVSRQPTMPPARQIHRPKFLSGTKESLNRTWFIQRIRGLKTERLFQYRYPGNQPCHPARQIHRLQNLQVMKKSLPRSRFPHGSTRCTKERLYRCLLMVMIRT